ncbi:MAG: alpha/beta fold hydrolase [Candidatus Cyclobacteriaceae bacterium M3_2C_046]
MKYFLILLVCLHFFYASAQDQLKPLGSALENFEYPYPVQYISLELQNEKQVYMAYMDVQPENPNGQNIMLLHGKNFSGAYWGQTAEDLAQRGYRVILPDQVGFGKSSKPADMQYTFQLLAQNTRNLLDTLEINQLAVAGHSMGGMLATRFALMYPEMTEKLILVNPIGLEDWKVKVPYQPVEFWYHNELKKDYKGIKNYMQENYYHGEWKPAYEPWLLLQAGWTLSPEYPVIAWNSALTFDMIFTQPVVYEFQYLQMPVLLIIGQLDRTALGKSLVDPAVRETLGNYPALGRQTRDKIPNASLVELDGVGHLPHLEAYQQFFDPLVKFLE